MRRGERRKNSWIASNEPPEVGFSCRLLWLERRYCDGLHDRATFSQIRFFLLLVEKIVSVYRNVELLRGFAAVLYAKRLRASDNL